MTWEQENPKYLDFDQFLTGFNWLKNELEPYRTVFPALTWEQENPKSKIV
ncbi:MAG: hypothetical protein AAF757_21080 [Cyanobacteria bacterium P01_D01_bin.116]